MEVIVQRTCASQDSPQLGQTSAHNIFHEHTRTVSLTRLASVLIDISYNCRSLPERAEQCKMALPP
jgi:hypothetical protein